MMKVKSAEQYMARYVARRPQVQCKSARRGQRKADIKRFIEAVFGRSTDSARGIKANHAARVVNIVTVFYPERAFDDYCNEAMDLLREDSTDGPAQ